MKSSQERLDYAKEYYQRNKEKIKEQRRLRWANSTPEQRERQRISSRKHYHKNSEKNKERAVAWMRKNKELVNARARLTRYRKLGLTERVYEEEQNIKRIKELQMV